MSNQSLSQVRFLHSVTKCVINCLFVCTATEQNDASEGALFVLQLLQKAWVVNVNIVTGSVALRFFNDFCEQLPEIFCLEVQSGNEPDDCIELVVNVRLTFKCLTPEIILKSASVV